MDKFRSATTTPKGTGRRIRRRVTILALSAAGAIGLIGPASAHAIALSDLQAEPAAPPDGNLLAGQNTDYEINLAFDAEHVQNLRIGLPPGVVGDPGTTVKCTPTELQADACPAESQVGETSVNATVTVVLVPVTLDIQGVLYNLEPQPGEPARFGIVLTPVSVPPLPAVLPPVILESAVELRQTDFGLDTVIENIPNTTEGLPTHINEMHVTLYGDPPGGTKPFIRNPTSCTPKAATFTADSYEAPGTDVTGTAPSFAATGCETLEFSPSFSARAGGPGATELGQKTPVSTTISQDDGEAGLKDAFVQLPAQFGPDIARLGQSCEPADFAARTCDPSTVLGPAVATSPLLTEPLTGNVHLVTNPGDLPKIGVDLTGQLSMQVFGALSLTNAVTFFGLPDIPISTFTLSFNGGPDGLVLVNARGLCDGPPPTLGTNFLGHNGATVTATTAATIEGCGSTAGKAKKKKKKKCKKAKKRKKKKKGKGASAAAKKKKKKTKKKKCKKKKKKKRKKGEKRR